MSKEYERRLKEEKPVVAFCYDFDKTLSPDDMQAQGYIQSVGYEVKDFWEESNSLAENNDMDTNLAYMYMMMDTSHGKKYLTKELLMDYGSKVELFPGVIEWFSRIREYGKTKGVIVEHYIISSGLKEMIEGTAIANEFEKIYASAFCFDKDGVAVWPAQAVNYTNKTQFLFRISKGVLDVNDQSVNDYFPPELIRVPFRNIVYVGDSDTDVPCMKLVNSNGGHSIAVYNPETKNKDKVYRMTRENRIKYFAAADYSEDSDIDKLAKAIIDRTAANEKLEDRHIGCMLEQHNYDANNSEHSRLKSKLISSLDYSMSFNTTHSVIKEMSQIEDWTCDDFKRIARISMENSQVRSIIYDYDIKRFLLYLIETIKVTGTDENIEELRRLLK